METLKAIVALGYRIEKRAPSVRRPSESVAD
jgi:hypothetical protein